VTPGFEVSQCSTQVHPNRDGFIGHLSPHWEMLIDMQSKLSRNSSSRVSRRSMEKENITHIMKDKARKEKLKRANPRCRQRRLT
jgi:hypothetical protein